MHHRPHGSAYRLALDQTVTWFLSLHSDRSSSTGSAGMAGRPERPPPSPTAPALFPITLEQVVSAVFETVTLEHGRRQTRFVVSRDERRRITPEQPGGHRPFAGSPGPDDACPRAGPLRALYGLCGTAGTGTCRNSRDLTSTLKIRPRTRQPERNSFSGLRSRPCVDPALRIRQDRPRTAINARSRCYCRQWTRWLASCGKARMTTRAGHLRILRRTPGRRVKTSRAGAVRSSGCQGAHQGSRGGGRLAPEEASMVASDVLTGVDYFSTLGYPARHRRFGRRRDLPAALWYS